MTSPSVFEKLVGQLSSKERREMLDKIKRSLSVSDEPLSVDEEAEQEVDLADEYAKFGLIRKLILFLKKLVSGKTVLELTEALLIKELAKTIQRSYPGLFSPGSGQLLTSMYEELNTLSEAVSLFKIPLDIALSTYKNDFFAFLGSMEMELTHEKLLSETNPYNRQSEFSQKTDKEVKEELQYAFDDIFTELNDMERESMYMHSKALYYLVTLAFFPFDKILNSFVSAESLNEYVCSLFETEDELTSLAQILTSFAIPPGAGLLQALFFFQFRDDLGKPDEEIDKTVKKQMDRADYSLQVIRNFNRAVPLIDILRFSRGEINYYPPPISGGEDWFTLYKRFWRKRKERLYKQFIDDRKKRNIKEEALATVGLEELPTLQYYNAEYIGAQAQLAYEISLSFLVAFVDQVIAKELNRILKVILIDAEFYKDQNRQEFTDAYNGLMRVPEVVQKIEYSLTPAGDTGKALEVVRHEVIPPPLKRKKIENLIREVEEEIRALMRTAQNNLHLLGNVLDGVLHGEVGGKYDTISNLAYLGGRENKTLRESINNGIEKLRGTEQLLASLIDLESET
jgi:hypothetical protein